ncbi:MAG: autotransporter domain-containing protein [Luteolibacter sp.]
MKTTRVNCTRLIAACGLIALSLLNQTAPAADVTVSPGDTVANADGGNQADTITVTANADGNTTVTGGINAGNQNDSITLSASEGGVVSIGTSIIGGGGTDTLTMTALTGGTITVGSNITTMEVANLTATNGSITVNGNMSVGNATGYTLHAGADGSISITGTIESQQTTLYATDGGIITLGNGFVATSGNSNDTFNLKAEGEGSMVTISSGGIAGGNGTDTLSIEALMGGSVNVTGAITSIENATFTATNGTINLTGSITSTGATFAADSGTINVTGNLTGENQADTFIFTAINQSSIVIDGAIDGGQGSDTITMNALSGSTITVGTGSGNAIVGGAGTDVITLTASDEGSHIEIKGNVNAGSNPDTITLLASNAGAISITGDIFGGTSNDADHISLTATGEGSTISVGGKIDAEGGVDPVVLNAFQGGLIRIGNGIDTGAGNNDSVTLNTHDSDSRSTTGAIAVVGGIGDSDGSGTSLVLNGGFTRILETSDTPDLDDYIGAMAGTGGIVIFGNITNIANFDKRGEGLAILTGYSNVDGLEFTNGATFSITDIDVEAGSLYLNGNLAAIGGGRTSITSDGEELGGTGTWNADILIHSGTFSAGQTAIHHDWTLLDHAFPAISSIGRLDIIGSLVMSNGAYMRFDLQPQLNTDTPIFGNGADLIVHTSAGGGSVNFGDSEFIVFSPTNIHAVVSDGDYILVSSDTNFTGDLPTDVHIQFNANVVGTGESSGSLVPTNLSGLDYQIVEGTNLSRFVSLAAINNGSGQDLVATVKHDYKSLFEAFFPGSSYLSSMGGAIDGQIGDAAMQRFIAALDYSDVNAAAAALNMIAPDLQIDMAVASMNAGYRTNRLMQSRLSNSRKPASRANTVRQPVSFASRAPEALTRMSENSSIWGETSYDWMDYKDRAAGTDYDGRNKSFTMGMEFQVAPDLLLGFLISGSKGEFDYSIGKTEMESLAFAFYGTWGENTGWYSDFSLGMGYHTMDDDREFGGIINRAFSETHSKNIMGLATVGYAFEHQCIKHGPFAGFEFQYMWVDGFAINNTLNVPMSVDDYATKSLRGLVGYRVEADYGKFNPYASVAYAHEAYDSDVSAMASMNGSPFAVTSDGPGSAFLINIGTNYAINERLTAYCAYRSEIAVDNDGFKTHGIAVGLDWKF